MPFAELCVFCPPPPHFRALANRLIFRSVDPSTSMEAWSSSGWTTPSASRTSRVSVSYSVIFCSKLRVLSIGNKSILLTGE